MEEKEKLIDLIVGLGNERGLSKDVILTIIEESLNAVYGYENDKSSDASDDEYELSASIGKHIEIDRETGNIELIHSKLVVEEVNDPENEVALEEVRKQDPDFEVGEIADFRERPEELGRIASHNAKQNIIQRLKEAERNMIVEKYQNKLWTIETGTIQRIEPGREENEKKIHLELDKVEGVMESKEQVPTEHYKVNEKLKVYVIDVREKSGKGKEPVVYVSRSHPNLVKKLFESEIPEISDGIVEIKGIAREAGSRTKIAVYSNDSEVEPVGSCVGTRGSRVESIVEELKGERIDIIKWSPSPAELITSSLSPARVLRTYVNEEDKSSLVIVQDDQLSLAIGKEGQNVRLAAKLTGWKIDIKSETQIRTSIEEKLFEAEQGEAPYEGSNENSSFSTSLLE